MLAPSLLENEEMKNAGVFIPVGRVV